MAHTPGPWRYDPARNSIVTDAILFDVLGNGSEMQPQDVISTFGAMSGDDINADIALIVAAPILLAALEKLHDACPVEYDYHGNALDKDLEQALNDASAAIAKAKGQTPIR